MQTVVIETALGQLQGEQQDGLRIFRGVPYAEPLAGLGRIRAAVPVKPWAGVKDATQYGAASAQDIVPMMDAGFIGDDCLNATVWSAANAGEKLPVMVWIHGGGFITGSNAQSLYEASRLARENRVVVVSINYRLGILGFGYWADQPELGGDSNVGLRDQIEALKWVRDNIASFGGDASKVTLFGESAGGMSIACLLASPKAKGLFHRAIIQSGSGDHVVTPSEAARITGLFISACTEQGAEALLGGDLEGIVKAQRACFKTTVMRGLHKEPFPQFGMTLLPVIGDDVLPEHPEQAFAKGAGKDIPVIAGTTANEWNLFYYSPQTMGMAKSSTTPPDDERVKHEFLRSLPTLGESMLAQYREVMPEASNADLFCAFETDRMFRIPTIRLLEARAQAGATSWNYVLNWHCPSMRKLKSCHVIDVPFVFGITDKPTGQFFTGGTEEAARLSAEIRQLWSSFASGEALQVQSLAQTWPQYTLDARESLHLAEHIELQANEESARRLAWADSY